MKSPGRMLCNGCYVDLGPDRFDEDRKTWVYVCPDCLGVDGPMTLEVHEGGTKAGHRSGTGVMAELGVYDGIIEALRASAGRWVGFAVMENLYVLGSERGRNRARRGRQRRRCMPPISAAARRGRTVGSSAAPQSSTARC